MGRSFNKAKREEIIKTAYKIYAELKYDHITTRQLAEHCNMSRALLHHYYNTMNELNIQIIIMIQNCLYEFLNEHIDIKYLETGWGFYYKLMMLETFKKKNLFHIYFSIELDADMLWQMITGSFFGIDTDYGAEKFNRHLTGDCLIHATIAQLTRCKMRGLINPSDREIVSIGMQAYYNYMNVPASEYLPVREKALEFVTDQRVAEFITFYENQLGWS